ncbi:MAG: hypothetical protein U9O85_03845 [Euryarchaeota archaeon]|nr:hypothetical protein [Euryarchaeota archaeon]
MRILIFRMLLTSQRNWRESKVRQEWLNMGENRFLSSSSACLPESLGVE